MRMATEDTFSKLQEELVAHNWTMFGSHLGVHPVQIAHGRRAALEQLEEIFVDGRRRKDRVEEVEKEALYEEIGRLKVELDWVKKSWSAAMRIGGRGWSPSMRA